jgi:hypothetical protein
MNSRHYIAGLVVQNINLGYIGTLNNSCNRQIVKCPRYHHNAGCVRAVERWP